MGSIKFPVTNVEAEQAALGCALLDAECAKQLATELTENDFTYEPHRVIFRAIKSLCQRGLDPDLITVLDTLQTWGFADECGGVQYLLKLQEIPPALSNFGDYLTLVKETALRHRVWELAQQLAEAAANGNGWRNLVTQLQALTEKATVAPRSVFVPLKEWQPQNERTPLVGDLIGSGELVLLYARPKAGKSILCANLVKGVAEGSTALGLPCRKGRVGVIALEDLSVWHERLTELEANGEDVFVAPIPLTFLDLSAIKQAITELQLALLVIDPLALFLRPLLQKERASLSRDYDAVYSALGALREVTQQTGCTIVLVHHERKESAGAEPTEAAALGSTALSGAVDVGLQLDSREQDGERRWRLSWWGRSVTAGELWLRLRPDLVFEPTTPPTPTTLKGRAIAVLYEILKERPLRYTDLVTLVCQQVGCSERTAKRAIDAAEKQGLIGQRADKFYELLDKSQIVSKGSSYSPCHCCHQKLSSVNGDNSVMTPVDTNDTKREVSQVSGSKGWHSCHQLGPQVCAFCGNKLSEISATPTCPFCWATGDETVAHCTCGEPLRWAGVGRALCPQCDKHWRWAGDHWEPDGDLPPDNCHEPDNEPALTPTVGDKVEKFSTFSGSAATARAVAAQAGVNEKTVRPDNVHDPNNEPEGNEERYIATEDWVASFFEASNEPAVFDLETDEAIPVAFPNLPAKEARCPRCGHRETVDPEVLLPPLCPACSSPMEWVSAPDPPNDPLIEAISRIANLSSQLETGGGQQ
jgi:predicted Zn-ribbon and HTH transcriptional regulator